MQGLAGLILAGILVQSYLLAVMLISLYLSRARGFGVEARQWHESADYVLGVPILLLVIVTLFARLGWPEIAEVALLGALFAGQVMVDRVQLDAPYVPALYAMNGLVMMALTTVIDRSQEARHDAPER